jgi:ammonium transporter Rh
MIVMTLFELLFYAINEYIVFVEFQANDVGGTMVIHLFGAVFGLACGRIVANSSHVLASKTRSDESSDYRSDLFSLIGTVSLYVFWPSFVGVLASQDANTQHRVFINTILALAASGFAAFAMSRGLRGEGKFALEDVQNATLAGGVAIGASADMMMGPAGALLIGIAAGTVSVAGYAFCSPTISSRWGFHDTCGVANLHGYPSLLGAISGVIIAALATDGKYGAAAVGVVFPGRANGRSASYQAWMQLASTGCTIGIAAVSGLFTGFILKQFAPLPTFFQDKDGFFVPEGDMTGYFAEEDEGEEPQQGAEAAIEASADIENGGSTTTAVESIGIKVD